MKLFRKWFWLWKVERLCLKLSWYFEKHYKRLHQPTATEIIGRAESKIRQSRFERDMKELQEYRQNTERKFQTILRKVVKNKSACTMIGGKLYYLAKLK